MKVVLLATVLILVCVIPLRAFSPLNAWRNNFKSIFFGMVGYRDANHHFPADRVDALGKAILSWRVEILPFVDAKYVWRKVKFDEPWDSPRNWPLVDEAPSDYCDAFDTVQHNRAHFAMPRGPKTLFEDGPKPQGRLDPTGAPLKIVLVELSDDVAVPWTQPDTWRYDPDRPQDGLARSHYLGFFDKGTLVACADGQARLLAAYTPDEVTRALFDPDGDSSLPTGFRWYEVLWQQPYAKLTAPVVAYSLLLIGWSVWIIRELKRGETISLGEWLVLVIGARQLVFLVSFVLFFRLDFLRTDLDPNHQAFYYFPCLAGCVVAIAISYLRRLDTITRSILFLMGVLLGLGALDGLGGHQFRSLEESFVDLGALSLFIVAALSCLLCAAGTALSQASERPFANWAGIIAAALPYAWFLTWAFSGYVYHRAWFQRILA